MSLHLFTTVERLVEVERQIEALRRSAICEDDFLRLRVIRAIAADLRGSIETAPSIALSEIGRRIAFANRSKTRDGYDRGAMVGLAEELIGRWPTVRQALERFGAAVEKETK